MNWTAFWFWVILGAWIIDGLLIIWNAMHDDGEENEECRKKR